MKASYTNKSETIGLTASLVLPNRISLNQKRISMIITNTGATTIFVAVDAEAVSGEGIPLYAGGSIERTATDKYLPPQAHLTAISNVAGGTLSIFEEVYQ